MKDNILTILVTIAGTIITAQLNHLVGWGPLIANGVVGLIAASILPASLAWSCYAASFVGMSSAAIIAPFYMQLLGGILVGVLIIITRETYAGLGGKAGTTAATATLLARAIMELFALR